MILSRLTGTLAAGFRVSQVLLKTSGEVLILRNRSDTSNLPIEVSGIKITTSPGEDAILVSDADGNGTWTDPDTVGLGGAVPTMEDPGTLLRQGAGDYVAFSEGTTGNFNQPFDRNNDMVRVDIDEDFRWTGVKVDVRESGLDIRMVLLESNQSTVARYSEYQYDVDAGEVQWDWITPIDVADGETYYVQWQASASSVMKATSLGSPQAFSKCRFTQVGNAFTPTFRIVGSTGEGVFTWDVDRIAYRQSTDPGAVGAGATWLDTDSDTLYVRDEDDTGWTEVAGGSSGAADFLDLTDTPASYSGQAGKALVVNTAEDGLEFGTVSSGGGSSSGVYEKWDSDAPPASPHTLNDEFDDASFDGWSTWNVDGDLSASEGDQGLELTHAGTGGNDHFCGIYKTLPGDSEWTAVVKLTMPSRYADFAIVQLGMAEDLTGNPTTARTLGIDWVRFEGERFEGGKGKCDAWLGNITPRIDGTHGGGMGPLYLKIRFDGSGYFFAVSRDGMSWTEAWRSVSNQGYTLTTIGVFMNSVNAVPVNVTLHWFRYVASDVGETGSIGGQRIPQGGSGGEATEAIYTKWDSDAPPASPHTSDDEFEGSSLGAAWTVPTGSVAVADGFASLGSSAVMYRAVPSGDWSAWARVSWYGYHAANVACGFGVCSGTQHDNGTGFELVPGAWGSYASKLYLWRRVNFVWNANLAEINGYDWSQGIYLRWTHSSGTVSAHISSDGIGWREVYSGTLTPQSLWITNMARGARVEFVRFTTDTSQTALLPGRLVPQGGGSLAVPWKSVPASASASGTAGQVAYDSNYLYLCVAADTWKRVSLSTW